MTLKELLEGNYRLLKVDSYNGAHQFLNENNDFGIAHFYNRKDGMILYGFNERVTHLLSQRLEKHEVIEAEKTFASMGLEFPTDLFMSVIRDHDGYFPLKVEALPDGTWSPKGTPFAQIRNTVKGFEQLVSWVEVYLMRAFFPSGCATHALHIRRYIEENMLPITHIHGFMERSYPTDEAAYWGDTAWGIAGLVGTDGVEGAAHFPEAGFKSIPAGAHKVIQNFKVEFDAYKRHIDYAAMTADRIVAFPIDTYNVERFISTYAKDLIVYAQFKGVKIALRPDSGKVFGQAVRLLKLAEQMDADLTVSCVIGEGVTLEKIKAWNKSFRGEGIDPALITYGLGGNFHNWITRETAGWAYKSAFSNGRDIMKLATGKESLAGEVDMHYTENGSLKIVTPDEEILAHTCSAYMVPFEYIAETGEVSIKRQTLPEIRNRVHVSVCATDLQERIKLSHDVKKRNYEVRKAYQ